MATLGYKLENTQENTKNSQILHTTRNGITALGVYNSDRFDVLEGSEINMAKLVHLPKYNKQCRELLDDSIIVSKKGKYILKITLTFNTPGGASDFVLGGSTNGRAEWKNTEGKTLDELYRKS